MSGSIVPIALPPPSNLVLRTHSPTRGSSRSPRRANRSPVRAYNEYYRDVSPNALLSALTASVDPALPKPIDKLIESIRNASPTQKTFARKVTETLKELKIWCEELDSWQWPGRFDAPTETTGSTPSNPSHTPATTNVEDSSSTSGFTDQLDGVFWGSLPAKAILAYEQRLEDIAGDLEILDIEEQRALVFENHVQSNGLSADNSLHMYDPKKLPQYSHLDDLTALTTLNVLEALPWYSHLISTMNGWSSRIFVLKHVPELQSRLRQAESLTTSAVRSQNVSAVNVTNLDEAVSGADNEQDTVRALLEAHLSEAGQLIDAMLDAIHGMQETLPEDWIDSLESLESAFTDWEAKLENEKILHMAEQPQATDADLDTTTALVASSARLPDQASHPSRPRDEEKTNIVASNNAPLEVSEADEDEIGVMRKDRDDGGHSSVQTADSPLGDEGEEPSAATRPYQEAFGGIEHTFGKGSDIEKKPGMSSFENEDTHFTEPDHGLTQSLNEGGVPITGNPSTHAIAHASGSSHQRTFTVDQQLERRINDILLQMPTRIEFNTEGGSGEAQEERSERESFQRSTPRGQNAVGVVGASSEPVLTLTAATMKDSRSARSGNSSQIKLFYLTQPGKDKPIKLYVRLIGDSGERVMVRVGGGWADLAEYLREYVTHHGRFASLDSSQNNDVVPSFIKNIGRRIGSRSSRMTKATKTSSKVPSPGPSIDGQSSKSAATRSSRGNEEESLGLAGPSSRRSDISADKQRWVEEMMSRAKRVSSGGGKASN